MGDFSLEGQRFITPSDLQGMFDDASAERGCRVEDAEAAEHPLEEADLLREVALWDEENAVDVAELERVLGEANDDEQLIRDDCIEDYLRDLMKDCGDIPEGLPSYVVIDWEATMDNLKMDYSEIQYGETTYWQRSC